MKRKICVVSGTRAEYGLQKHLIAKIDRDPRLDLQIVATGMHLSCEFGLTYREIENDGFTIAEKVEILLSSDSASATSKAIGLGFILFSECYSRLRPDIVVVLGDRFELLAVAGSALIAGIPIAHIHGGELTAGVFDEQIRHAITKMSHLHFTATEEYRKRVVQLGEDPDRVFNCGSPAIDELGDFKPMSREELEKELGSSLSKRNLLVTFHPITSQPGDSCRQFAELLEALDSLSETKIIFTHPNADPEGRAISAMIRKYVSDNPKKACSFVSMGRRVYLSAMSACDAVVGNSSSGLLEAPSFKKGTINIGCRQDGRTKAESVIDCQPDKMMIAEALNTLYSNEFQNKLKSVENPYGKPGSSEFIKNILASSDISRFASKKFFDINFDL